MAASPDPRDRCVLTLPNDLAYLQVALDFVRRMAELCGFPETDRRRIELAVEEAASNVVQHAFPAGVAASYEIVCRRIAGGLEICLHDRGMPWDPSLNEDYDPAADLERQTGRGLGAFLIRRLMDAYTYANLGADGKQVCMRKYLESTPYGEGGADLPAPEAEPDPTPREFEIRRLRPREAVEVSRLVFECYGYSYAHGFVYYPERVAAMNESGALLSAVAVDKASGEFAGHTALLFDERLPPEVAIAVTRPRFRGQGIARRLGEFLDREARAMGLKGVYMKEVTVHPYTQKFARKLGYRDCGMLLAHSPKTLSFKGIADEATQRNSNVLGFRALGEPAPRALHLPERHAEVIAQLYATLEIPLRRRADASPPAAGSRSEMCAKVNPARALCEIHFVRYGDDLPRVLRQELRRVRRQELQLVELFLSLEDPATPWAVTEAEKLGFFFTGILPETAGGDALILAYFNGIQVEYDKLVIDDPATLRLLDYIQAGDPTMA